MKYLIILIASFFIAARFGERKTIGFGWSLFFCIFFSPLIGALIISLSKPKDSPSFMLTRKSLIYYYSMSIIYLIMSILSFFYVIELSTEAFLNDVLFFIFLSIGFSGAAIYMFSCINEIKKKKLGSE